MTTRTTDSINYVPAAQQKNLRSCMACSLVQLENRFLSVGCPNCPFLELQNAPDLIDECTSPVFEGLFFMADPPGSWAARWIRRNHYVEGTYALKVVGRLPDSALRKLEEAGIRHVP
ncbi:MAG: hypothetical protein M1826_002933 [Phylliscum demangeonii]|nr:MAG: hypothetical protein M1826_002933 [Phylliscum demangeonii]